MLSSSNFQTASKSLPIPTNIKRVRAEVQKLSKHAKKWLAIISDSNPAIILKASISKRKLDLLTRIYSQRALKVAGDRENVGIQVVYQSGIQCYNCKEYGHVARECQKLKWVNDAAYDKEKMLLCKQEEAVFQLNAEQADWRDDNDDEPEDQELEAHYMYMAQIQEVTLDVCDILEQSLIKHPEQPESVNDTYPVKQDEHNIIIDSLDMSCDREQDDQDDNDDLAKERDLLASLIMKLKCEINDSKNRNKFLETSNKALVDKLKDLKKFQAELDRYHDVNYSSKVAIDCAKTKGDLMLYKMEFEKSFNKYTRKINDLNQMFSEMKKEHVRHQETISIMSQEKEAKKKFHKSREDKELEKVIALENKIKVLDDIVYKNGQSFQTMNMLNHNCKTSFVKTEFLKKAQRVNPRLYDIEEMVADLRYSNSLEHEVDSLKSQLEIQKTQFLNEIDRLSREYYYADHMNAILGVYTTLDEFTDLQCDYVDQVVKCECLEKELLKSNITSKSFEALQQHAINLELAL
ncbi:retrovirus-related pol polyprotein from transposon TNT 1-94 [Tanacetum coccineum]